MHIESINFQAVARKQQYVFAVKYILQLLVLTEDVPGLKKGGWEWG